MTSEFISTKSRFGYSSSSRCCVSCSLFCFCSACAPTLSSSRPPAAAAESHPKREKRDLLRCHNGNIDNPSLFRLERRDGAVDFASCRKPTRSVLDWNARARWSSRHCTEACARKSAFGSATISILRTETTRSCRIQPRVAYLHLSVHLHTVVPGSIGIVLLHPHDPFRFKPSPFWPCTVLRDEVTGV